MKKYPTNHSRTIVNPYSLEINQNAISSQMMMQPDHGFQFAMGRNYINHASNYMNNFPIQHQMNYNIGGSSSGGGGGGGDNFFTISGLNLNLGGGAAASSQPVLRPMPPPPPPPTQVMNIQQEVMTSSMLDNCAITSEAGYGAEMNSANYCADLDNYWATY